MPRMSAQRRAPARSAALVLTVAALVAACSAAPDRAQPSDRTTTTQASATSMTFSKPGPYKVGVITLPMGDTQVDVWYPAAPGAQIGHQRDSYDISDWLPAAFKAKVPPNTAPFTTDAYRGITPSPKGPFPLVLFAHGFGGYRDQSTLITTHIASWGFIVASPDFVSRDLTAQFGQVPANPPTDSQVLSDTASLVRAQSGDASSLLHGLVKPGKLAVIGHSAGGFDAIQYASNPQVITYISLAAGQDTGKAKTTLADKPSLFMSGAEDGVVPEPGVHATYEKAPAPSRFVELPNSGHLAFADICLIGQGQGGVLAIASSLGITVPPDLARLATDGCEQGRLDVRTANTVTNHFVVAQLRWAFGIDRTPVGLEQSITDAFPTLYVTYQQKN